MKKKDNTYLSVTKGLISFFVLLFSFLNPIWGNNPDSKADSIILNVLNNKEVYGKYIEEFEAEVYVRGNTFVRKKNFLYRYAPDFLYLDRKGQNNFIESIVNIHFRSPNHFIQQIKAINGPKIYIDDIRERVMQFLNMNIYNPTIFNSLILLPGKKDVSRYYRFEYVETIDTLGYSVHKIRCRPITRSQKLINGYLYILDKHWTVLEFDVWGKLELFDYRVETKFGLPGETSFLLPQETRLTFNTNLLGNQTTNHYYSSYDYQYIKKREEGKNPPETGYDLSKYLSIRLDSIPYITDENFWKEKRAIPLTTYEMSLLEQKKVNSKDSIASDAGAIVNFAKGAITPKRFRYNNSSFFYSGLVNPLKLAYSRLDGVTYWQQFRFRNTRKSGEELSFEPSVGFLFKYKEVYFRIPLNWTFHPERMGELNLNFGNKNHTYGYRTQKLIEEEVSDSISFDDLNLDYFRHYNFILKGNYELLNGLLLDLGIDYSWYIPAKSDSAQRIPLRLSLGNDVSNVIQDHYRTFSPHTKLTWTPGQYYRISGKKKEYVRSDYPTFSAEYTRGINGVFESNSDYERLEVDIQQNIPIGLMRSIHYYVGIGTFTNTRSFYFADFSRFQKRNFPESWDDPIGGVFHLLDGKWYNASDSYIQAHFMYEAPFIIFQFFRGITKDILKERFYISQLYTPELPCYTELGYGVGNFLGNIGIFISLNKGRFDGTGIKFAFELGR